MSKSLGSFEFEAIAKVESPFKERYGVPRQPGLAANAIGKIKFKNDPDLKTALKSLEQFSHIWIVFVFHAHGGNKWKPSIRPPRLGGRTKVGVLASRSPHRPNPVGISAVELREVNLDAAGGPELVVGGIDLLDGTPVLDIKPYIPYADAIEFASAGWASEEIQRHEVLFSPEAERSLVELAGDHHEDTRALIEQILELDPRPAYQKRDEPAQNPQVWGKIFGMLIGGFEVKYCFSNGGLLVKAILMPE